MSIASVISTDLMNEAKLAFDQFDDDGDGYIESTLIERCMRAIGYNPTVEEIVDIIKDTDNCGISYYSLLYIIYRHARNVDTKKELIDSLEIFDKQKTGKIYVEDLARLCKCIRRPFTDQQIQEVLQDCNVVKGMVQYEEFIQKLLYP